MYLQEVDPYDGAQVQALYELLKERTPIESISHKEMPSFEQHGRFVRSKPYEHWYLIRSSAEFRYDDLGSIYLTRQDEIGLHLFTRHRGCGYGTMAMLELMKLCPRHRYLANINPMNGISKDFFAKHGFAPIQVTMELTK